MSQCNTETLFEDLLQSEERAKAQTRPKHNKSDLIKFVDNFLKVHGMPMTTMKQYYEWLKKRCRQQLQNNPVQNKNLNKFKQKKAKATMIAKFCDTNDKYRRLIQLGKEDWLLSTDGVVMALHYNVKDKHFVAKVHYKTGTKVMQEQITVLDDWVIDTYGKDVASKLIDHDMHQEFIKLPKNEDGTLTVLKLDQRNITRVKHYPPKHIHKMDVLEMIIRQKKCMQRAFGKDSWMMAK
jgi:hypothetical protein